MTMTTTPHTSVEIEREIEKLINLINNVITG